MVFAVCVGFLSTLAILVVMVRIDLRKFMGYPVVTDIAVTMLLALLLYGTYQGIVAAITGGLIFSGFVTIIRRIYGYKRLERRGLKLIWVTYPGSWTMDCKEWAAGHIVK